MLHGLLITENREAAELFGALIRSSEQIAVERTFCPAPSPYQLTMALNALSLDVAFVDVSSSNASAACAQIRRREKPAAIVGFTMDALDRPCPQSLTPFTLEFPLSVQQLLETVRSAVRGLRPAPYKNVTVFLPAKAGAGASTTVLNVAAHLSGPQPRRVLVAECDLRSGTISESLDLLPQEPVAQTMQYADSAEALIWPRHVSTKDGIDFLLTNRDHNARRPEWHDYYHLLAFLTGRYDHVLLDLPELVNEASAEAVRAANRVYLVTTPDVLAVHLARQRIRELASIGIEPGKVGVLLNREQPGQLRRTEISEFLGCEIVAGLPCDDRAMNRAMLLKTFVETRSDLGRAFGSIAQAIAGEERTQPWTDQRWSLRELFSRSSVPRTAALATRRATGRIAISA